MLDREVSIRDWLRNGYNLEEFVALEQDGCSLSYILDVLIGRTLHTIIDKKHSSEDDSNR